MSAAALPLVPPTRLLRVTPHATVAPLSADAVVASDAPQPAPPTGAGAASVALDPVWLAPHAPHRRREHDHRLNINDDVAPASLQDRARRNLTALRMLQQLEADHRTPSPDERDTLARYSGWGALSRVVDHYPGEWKHTAAELRALASDDEWQALQASTPNAHYTSLAVVDAMWRAALHLGLPDDARVLEPALGVGHFFGLQPDHVHGPRTGIELEPPSARLARALYPDSAVHTRAFESYPHLGGYDLVIGNVPFGRYGVHDAHYRAQPVVTRSIHDNYLIGRALDELRPGGLAVLITSRYTLDKINPAFRRWADERASLVAALRLPSSSFERSAGTKVVTDIVFLQRRFEGTGRAVDWLDVGWLDCDGLREPMNTDFLDHPERVLGTPRLGHGLYSSHELRVDGELDPARLHAALERLPADLVPPRSGRPAQIAVPARSHSRDTSLVLHNGVLCQREGDALVPVPETDTNRQR